MANSAVEYNMTRQVLDMFEEMQTFNNENKIVSIAESTFPENNRLEKNEMCFYKIEQLSFDEDYPRREAFENVLMSLNNANFNFVYILEGTKQGINLYLGVVKNKKEATELTTNNYADTIKNVFEGNFSGSKLRKLKGEELSDVALKSMKYKSSGTIVGIPSVNKKDKNQSFDFQGIDRLINSMLGLEWRLVVVCEPVVKEEVRLIQKDIYELYNKLAMCSKLTMQSSANFGSSITQGSNVSDSNGKSISVSETKGTNKGTSNSSGTSNSGKSESKQTTSSVSKDHSEGSNFSFARNSGTSNSVTLEIANKRTLELMKYVDEELLERMKLGFSKGLYKSSLYYMAKNPSDANRLKVAVMSLFQGNSSTYSPMQAFTFDIKQEELLRILNNYQNQYIILDNTISADIPLLHCRPYSDNKVGLNTYLTASEISLLTGLPQKEVSGLILQKSVEFGLNAKQPEDEKSINLGYMLQKGRELKNIPFMLNKSSMSKHTFIAGVTGSGKTTTCHKLLAESDIPFLVIEPAKTEYRTLINSERYPDLTVFTLGNETVAPFRINPFELIKGEIISAHIDMLKATFTSAFPMEGSMPQLLEEAIYSCYEKKGWDVDLNINTIYRDNAFDMNVDSFPVMSDLLRELKQVVSSKGFGDRLQSEYIGSLVSRLSNLTVGSKGSMLNCSHSMNFEYVVEHNVIFEMEELRSPEDKALFMGFILTRMTAIIKAKHKLNQEFKHLTLIEEAHRLLSKVEFGDSGSKKVAVETFTDLLAEVRKYGEGLIIVDQIPNKLASEVLKNTNTKIIHKILAKDDKETVGDTMLMDEKQKEFLSALSVGECIVFTEDTNKPIHIHIENVSNTNEAEISDDIVLNRFRENKYNFGNCYRYLNVYRNYKRFTELAKTIECRNNNDILNNEFREIVNKISYEDNIDKKEIWRALLNKKAYLKGDEKTKKDEAEKRTEKLVEFFVNDFDKTDFSANDVSENIATFIGL